MQGPGVPQFFQNLSKMFAKRSVSILRMKRRLCEWSAVQLT